MPHSLTPAGAAKAYAALLASVLLAGLLAWQESQADGLTGTEAAIAVAAAVLPPFIAWLVPNEPKPTPDA